MGDNDNTRSYSGWGLVIGLGVALGTAIYYYFNQPDETPSHGASPSNPGSSNARESLLNGNCRICTDRLNNNRRLRQLRCGHVFHHYCIVMWLNQLRICPTCGVNI